MGSPEVKSSTPARGSIGAIGWLEAPQPQDLVITLLGSYVRPHATVWSGGLVRLLAEFGFSTGAARVALARLVRRGLIARGKRGRLVHYTLTARLSRLLAEGDRRIFSLGLQEHRAHVWTVLWHGIPEDRRLERGRLARRLRFLGFGPVQDGTWVSPHDREQEVTRLVSELEVADHVGVLLGRSAHELDMRALVRRAWDLGALAERYRAFATEFEPYTAPSAWEELDDQEAFKLRTRLVHLFRGFPFLDPELPDALMPDAAARSRAIEVFHTTYGGLAERSQRHFDDVTGAYDGRDRATSGES